MRRGFGTALAAAAALAMACAPQAPAPGAGASAGAAEPTCAYCRMLFQHAEYGGEIRTTTGRRLVYDAVECMAAAVLTDSVPPRLIRSITVVVFEPPHAAVNVRRAHFLRSPGQESPMGLNFSAHAGEREARAAQGRYGGERLDWRQVLVSVDSLWFRGKLDVEQHVDLPAAE